MANVRIIGIDPGLRKTGWGIIESDGVRLTYLACGPSVQMLHKTFRTA